MSVLQIPRWFIVTVGLICTIVGTTWALAGKLTEYRTQSEIINIRFCRIEQALHIVPWPTCPR